MNWDAIGAISQMVGSVAVFITLGYLAGQVRHAREENASSRYSDSLAGRFSELAINKANNAQWISSVNSDAVRYIDNLLVQSE